MTLEHFKLPRDDWYDITNWDYEGKEVYDPDKFTVVGSPTITDDGVASGFSENDYIITPTIDYSNANSWEIYTQKFSILSMQNLNTILCNNTNTQNTDGIAIFIRGNGKTSWSVQSEIGKNIFKRDANTNFQINTEYQFKLEFTGSAYNLYLSTNGGSFVLVDTCKSSIKANINISIAIGRGINQHWKGNPIDLKHFSITVDGKEVFKGTKTVPEKVPPKGEIVGRLYKEALIENFNAIEAKLNELSGLTAYETQVPDFSNYNYEDVTLDSPNNKVVNLQSFLKIMNLIGVPIECRFTGKLCNKVTYYDKNMRYHTIVNQKLDNLGVDGKVYIVLDSSNDTVSAVSDITDLTNKFLLGVYDNGRVYNLRSTGLVDINVLTHLCDMSVEPFFIGSLNGTRATEGIYRNGRIVGAWGRESKGAYPKDITLFDIGRQ